MKSCQHVGELQMGIGVRRFEAHFGNPKRTPDGHRPITMPDSVDDQSTSGARTTKNPDSLAHHINRSRFRLNCLRRDGFLIPNNRVMLRQVVDQSLEVIISSPLAQLGPTEFAPPGKSFAQQRIRSLKFLR